MRSQLSDKRTTQWTHTYYHLLNNSVINNHNKRNINIIIKNVFGRGKEEGDDEQQECQCDKR